MTSADMLTHAQKFQRGDLVISSGWRKGEALVLGSYSDLYGDSNGPNTEYLRQHYSLIFTEDGGECSWFDAPVLTLVRKAEPDAIEQLKAKAEARAAEQSELAWIVEHWNPQAMPGASLEALASLCGLGSCWGTDGEGVSFYNNALSLFRLFNEPMKSGIDAVRAKIDEIKADPAKVRWSNHLFRSAENG